MSLLLNMLSRLVITFLPRSKRLLISWLQSPSAVNLEPPKNKVWHYIHSFPIYFPWSNGTRYDDLNKACGSDGIPIELFQILKDDTVKVMHSICQQIWKTQSWSGHRTGKISFHSNPKEGNAKECSKYCTITLISQAGKVTLFICICKILWAELSNHFSSFVFHQFIYW